MLILNFLLAGEDIFKPYQFKMEELDGFKYRAKAKKHLFFAKILIVSKAVQFSVFFRTRFVQ